MSKFIEGNKYSTRLIGDSSIKVTFEIVKRTACFVWLLEDGETILQKRKVSLREGSEIVLPFGNYSKCPSLSSESIKADSVAEEAVVDTVVEDSPKGTEQPLYHRFAGIISRPVEKHYVTNPKMKKIYTANSYIQAAEYIKKNKLKGMYGIWRASVLDSPRPKVKKYKLNLNFAQRFKVCA